MKQTKLSYFFFSVFALVGLACGMGLIVLAKQQQHIRKEGVQVTSIPTTPRSIGWIYWEKPAKKVFEF